MRNHQFILALSLLWLTPGLSMADGMMMTSSTSGTTQVQATAQRAVLWLRDGTWEVHIQPVFDREQVDSAWVVPFPVRPEVSESNLAFLNQLEILTSPVFARQCYSYGDGGSGGLDAGSAGGGDTVADAHVQIWEQGTVGDLDFVVLTADQGSYLVQWLQENGFGLPDGAGELMAEMELEEQYFFVARVSADVDPRLPLQPVRFKLPCLCAPLYPLRLTSLGVTGDQTLDLTLWVIFKNNDSHYLPASHPFFKLGVSESALANSDDYQAALDDFFERNPPGSLALLFGGGLSQRIDQRGVSIGYDTIYYESMDLELPDEWSEEIQEIGTPHGWDNNWWTFRFQARLDGESMEQDLVFGRETGQGYEWIASNLWLQSTGYCTDTEEHSPSDGGSPDAGWLDASTPDSDGSEKELRDDSSGCATSAESVPAGVLVWLTVVLGLLGRARTRRHGASGIAIQ